MFFDANTRFTIGQFAKLHDINKKTLMWYDEIGLLKPAAVGENGYRYYTYQQSAILETILLLRELNVSLPQIKTFLEARSAPALEALLAEKITELDAAIAHLRSIRAMLAQKQQEAQDLCRLDLSAIVLAEKSRDHYFATVPTAPGVPLEEEIGRVLAKAREYQVRRLHDAAYGSLLPVDALYAGRWNDYTALTVELPCPTQRKGLHVQPKGRYLRAWHQGPWGELPARYQQILAWAETQGLRLTGYAYEKGVNELVIDAPADYITQIEIAVSR